jgi:hypothetical protein
MADTGRSISFSLAEYHLYYRQADDLIEIVAFWHASRGSPLQI